MLNQVIMVGRLVSDPTIEKLENGKEISKIVLAIPRSYKNENGEYETDFINVNLFDGVATNTCEYCKKGDIIGVKGRLQCSNETNENGEIVYRQKVVAEKVTFLSSKKATEDEE